MKIENIYRNYVFNFNRYVLTKEKMLAGLAENARHLLFLGTAIDAKDRGGASPLFRGCFFGHEVVVALLLDAGADVRHTNGAFETPLYIAALRGHAGAVQLLLDVHRLAGFRWQVRAMCWALPGADEIVDCQEADIAASSFCDAGVFDTLLNCNAIQKIFTCHGQYLGRVPKANRTNIEHIGSRVRKL